MRTAIALMALVGLLAASGAHAQRIAQSGSIIMDLDQTERTPSDTPFPVPGNILDNPGFEDGVLTPWTTNNWQVTSADAQSGMYSAEDIGNYWIRQDFDPVAVSEVISVTFWSKQPEAAIQAFDLFYSATDYDEFVVFPNPDWGFFDMTANLRPAGSLEAIRLWGYSGGGPDPDLTRIDDIAVDVEMPTPSLEATWGRVKSLYR
jgi:hypothetical protein